MLAEEEGPFSLFDQVRCLIDPGQTTWIGRGIRCIWCLSFWIGLMISGLLYLVGKILWWEVPIWGCGLSGGAILIHSLLQWFLITSPIHRFRGDNQNASTTS